MEKVRIILEAVNSGKLNEARQIVETALKTDSENGVFWALKTHVAHEQGDKTASLQAAGVAAKKCTKHTLRLFLIPVLLEYKANDILTAAFERTNRLDPQDIEVTESWVECALQLGSLDSAQKALMASMRNSAEPRSACYQSCLVMALNYFDQHNISVPTKERTNTLPNIKVTPTQAKPGSALFPTLAQRMLAKNLPVSSAQECYVTALVQRMTSNEALVDFLLANLEYVQGSIDSELLLLGALEEAADFTSALKHGEAVVKTIDSLQIWKIINHSAAKLQHSECPVNRILQRGAQTTNERLAVLDWVVRTGGDISTPLVDCYKHLKSKPGAYPLLKSYVTESNLKLLSDLDNESLESIINLTKFRHNLGLASTSSTELLDLHAKYVAQTKVVEKDYLFGTDALLIVVSRILREGKEFAREQAIQLLEHALNFDPCHFQVNLLLVALYKSLGFHTMASNKFKHLGIKNIQLEGLGYLVSTRVSTLAPKDAADMVAQLCNQKKLMPNFGYYSFFALSNDAFTQFQGIFNLGYRLNNSLSTSILASEKLRLCRFNRGLSDVSDLLEIDFDHLVDNRDFNTGFDDGFGPIFQSQLSSLSLGPVPDAAYARAYCDAELFIARYRQQLTANQSNIAKHSEIAIPDTVTEIERWNLQVVNFVVKLGTGTNASLPTPPSFPEGNLDWQFFHWAYTILDIIKIAQQLKVTALDAASLKKLIRNGISKHQQASNAYEKDAVKFINDRKLPGTSSKLIRTIKQQHLDALKQLADQLK